MKKLILDLDTGIDDTLAMSLAMASPEVELIGIIGTYGNVYMDQGLRNDLAITDLFGKDVKVYRGLEHALKKDSFEVMEISSFIHGKNGVGECQIPDSKRKPEEIAGVDFLIEAAHTYKEDLIYVPTGPLTNLAAALQKDPSISSLIGRVVFMGGALTVPGNVSDWSEANINQDPDAADYVVKHINTTMIGLDVTLQTLLTTKETAKWRELGTERGKFLADITDYYIKAYEVTAPGLGGCGLHDPLAVGVAINPDLVECLPINLMVETEPPLRGRTIGDLSRLSDPVKKTQVAVRVKKEQFLDMLVSRLSSLAA